jgi:hypothetical protein
MKSRSIRLLTLARIFRHPTYAFVAIASAAIFLYIFRYLIAANNYGIFLIFVPMYVVYALVATSGILFSISLFAIAHSVSSRKIGGIGGSIEGVLLPSLGGLVAGCGCAFPVLESVLMFFGVDAFEAVGIVSAINSYQLWILSAMIAINLATIYYYLGRIPMPPIKKRK